MQVVAIQGEAGAFSQEAARKLVTGPFEVAGCERFEDVFRTLKEGRCDWAVVPIENTLHGSVHENYDHLLAFELPIIAETNLRIVHNLIAPPGVAIRSVRRVYSHPVALNQCRNFFAANPRIERVPFYDTAGSVKMLMEQRPDDAAAIASSVAAEIYGGTILKRSIEDDRQNYTRFFLLERPKQRRAKRPHAGDPQKTSVVFSTRNQPGALFRALAAFALRDLSLTKLESRPVRGKPFEYWFYLDFLGSPEDTASRNALAHLGEVADFLRVLGSYPQGDGPGGVKKRARS